MGSYGSKESNYYESSSGGFERNLDMASVEEKDSRVRLLCIEVTTTSRPGSWVRLSFRELRSSLEGK